MGKDIEILNDEYNRIATNRAAIEANTELTAEEKTNALAGYDRALAALEGNVIEAAKAKKAEIQAAIAEIERKIEQNNKSIDAKKEELARRQDEYNELDKEVKRLKEEIEAELAKPEAERNQELIQKNQELIQEKTDLMQAKKVQIDALTKDINKMNRETNGKGKDSLQTQLKEQKKLLIPIMDRFGDKVFTPEEMTELEKLKKSIQRGKDLAEKRNKKEEIVADAAEGEELGDEEVVDHDAATLPEEPVVDGDDAEELGDEEVVDGDDAEELDDEEVVDGDDAEELDDEEEEIGTSGTSTSTVYATVTTTGTLSDREKFEKIYERSKAGIPLLDDEYDMLVEIMSDPSKYDDYDITTGRIFNKGKVLLKAMGRYVKETSSKTIRNTKNQKIDDEQVFEDTIEDAKKAAISDGLKPTSDVTSWRGVKKFMNEDTRLASEEILDKIIADADTKMGEMPESSEDIAKIKEDATKQKEIISKFRETTEVYKEVRRDRGQKDFKFFGLFGKKESSELLAAGEEVPTDSAGPVVTESVAESPDLVDTLSDLVEENIDITAGETPIVTAEEPVVTTDNRDEI